MTNEVCFASASELAKFSRGRALSARAVMRAYRRQIERVIATLSSDEVRGTVH